MWSENIFTQDGMKIEGRDWKTRVYKLMAKTGSLKLNRKFENWLTRMTFGYDTSIQEFWCFVKMFFSFHQCAISYSAHGLDLEIFHLTI